MPTTHSDVEIIGNGEYDYKEGVVATGATVYPGMIVEITGENSDYEETPQVQPVSSVEKIGENFRVALTPDTPPKGDDTDIPRQHEYTEGEHIQFAVVQSGAIVQNALLADGIPARLLTRLSVTMTPLARTMTVAFSSRLLEVAFSAERVKRSTTPVVARLKERAAWPASTWRWSKCL